MANYILVSSLVFRVETKSNNIYEHSERARFLIFASFRKHQQVELYDAKQINQINILNSFQAKIHFK